MPAGNLADASNAYAYAVSTLMHEILKQVWR